MQKRFINGYISWIRRTVCFLLCMLLTLSGCAKEQEAVDIMRRALNGMKSDEAVDSILNMFDRTKNNVEFVQMVKKTKFI